MSLVIAMIAWMSVWCCFCLCEQKTAYEMRISDWSSDVFSSDLGSVNAIVGLVRFSGDGAGPCGDRDPGRYGPKARDAVLCADRGEQGAVAHRPRAHLCGDMALCARRSADQGGRGLSRLAQGARKRDG